MWVSVASITSLGVKHDIWNKSRVEKCNRMRHIRICCWTDATIAIYKSEKCNFIAKNVHSREQKKKTEKNMCNNTKYCDRFECRRQKHNYCWRTFLRKYKTLIQANSKHNTQTTIFRSHLFLLVLCDMSWIFVITN